MWTLVPTSQLGWVWCSCAWWCRYSVMTSHYSLSRLLTRMSHLCFTIYYLILHLVQYFFSLKNFDRLRSRKGITTGNKAQRGRRSWQPQQQQGNARWGSLPSSLAPRQVLLWQLMETWNSEQPFGEPDSARPLWKQGQFRDSLKCPQQLFFNLLIRAAFLAAFAAPVLQSWLAVW